MLSACRRARPPALRAGSRPDVLALHARRASSAAVGLVGLPNVGKSTLFNGLVRASLATASNRPFTTIEPNVSTVQVPDAVLPALAAAAGSARTLGWCIDVHDIAGLIRGAAGGAGLGNAFLADIRATGALVQVLRCFAAADVTHVEESVDAVRDVAILENELLLADLQSVERRLERKPPARAGAAGVAAHALLRRAREVLEDGKPARVLAPALDRDEAALWPTLQLLTQKPCIFVANVGEDDMKKGGNAMSQELRAMLAERAGAGAELLVVSAQVEAEAALLADADRAEFLDAYGLARTGLDAVVERSAAVLGLHAYYTVGPQEARAWPIRVGDTALDAARAIHSDIADGFVRAEVCAAADYVKAGGERAARDAQMYKSVGREHVMQGGEVALFRHQARKSG